MPQLDDTQVQGDVSISGQLDVGTSEDSTAKFSVGPSYVEVAGVPIGLHKGLLLMPQEQPPASSEGAIIYLNGAGNEFRVRWPSGGDSPL